MAELAEKHFKEAREKFDARTKRERERATAEKLQREKDMERMNKSTASNEPPKEPTGPKLYLRRAPQAHQRSKASGTRDTPNGSTRYRATRKEKATRATKT